MIWILLLIIIMLFYFQPWVDVYTDYRNQEHIVLWYTNLKGTRSYLNIVGNRE